MFGEYLVSHPLSKSLYFRKTKKDQYLLYSNGSELLVFDKDTWEGTIINSLPDLEKNSELYKLLKRVYSLKEMVKSHVITQNTYKF